MELYLLELMGKHWLKAFGIWLVLCLYRLLFLLYKSWHGSTSTLMPPLPPCPSPRLPIIGNMHLLLLGDFPVRSLFQLARQHGPIFMLQLGCHPTVVISSAGLAKDILINCGHVLTHRPLVEFGRRMFYGEKSLLMMPYNSRWRSIRKMCDQEVFCVKKLQALRHVREEEVRSMVAAIAKESEVKKLINLTSHIIAFTSGVITRLVVSAKLPDVAASHMQHMMRELGELIGVPILSDSIPALRWLDPGRYKHRMDALHKSLDAFLEGLLQERKYVMLSKASTAPHDLLTALLSAHLDADYVKATVEDMLGAGTDTLGLIIEWTMAEILCKPTTVLKKLKEELDMVVGQNCTLVDETYIAKLAYLRAVIKESFRLHPPAPIVFRQVPKQPSCSLGGFRLPEDAHVMVNVWAIGRDPGTWSNPDKFIPERFLESDVDIRGNNFELIPFGAGRRRCPGMGLGITLVELSVANLIHSFDWKLPLGVREEDVLRECGGVVAIRKETPLMVIPQPCKL